MNFPFFKVSKPVLIRQVEPAAQSVLASVPSAPAWLPEDASNWNTFLKTGTGITLMQRLRALEAHNAIQGAQDVFHTVHSAGRAAGFTDAVEWLSSLRTIPAQISPASGDQDATDADSPEAMSLREHFAS